MASDRDGNVYLSGSTEGSLGGGNAGLSDAFVAMYSAEGALRWIKQVGTSGGDYASGVATDRDGNVYISGSTQGALGGAQRGQGDAFVARYTADGSLGWIRQLGTAGDDVSSGVATDRDGNLYITGSTAGSLGSANQGGYDAFVAKYSAKGTLRWRRQLGTPQADISHGVATDRRGNIYICFATQTDSGIAYASLAKYSQGGELRWQRQPRISQYDEAYGVATDRDNNVYIAGYVYIAEDTNGDAFLAKYSAEGSLRWIRRLGTSGSDEGALGVATDRNGDVYISGMTTGSLGEVNAGDYDAFVAKYSAEGALRWTRQLGAIRADRSSGVATGRDAKLYIVGDTEGSLGGANAGEFDAFVAKFATRR